MPGKANKNKRKQTNNVSRKARRARNRRQRRNGRSAVGRGPAGDNINTLLPNSINNKATMPNSVQDYRPKGCEAIKTITVPTNTEPGTIVFDSQISHEQVARLKTLAASFQRITWIKVVLKLVALNGSLVRSGYTAGFIEDPEITMPSDKKQTVQFLTALRGSSIRQNWVSSSVGQVVNISNLPEMYTSKGIDPRRFYIGRYVVVLNGSPGTEETTFQVMMDYEVHFKVPLAKSLDNSAATFTFTESVFPGSIGVTGSLTNEIGKVDIVYAGALPQPGVYSVPNAVMYLRNNILDFGWNENTVENNQLQYKDWPKDLLDNSNILKLAYLVVPKGATSMADCGFRTELNGATVLFKTLTLSSAVLTTTANSDQTASGVNIKVDDTALSWWLPPISYDNIQFVSGDEVDGRLPEGFARQSLQSIPIILAGTGINLVGPPPSSVEDELTELKFQLHKLKIKPPK